MTWKPASLSCNSPSQAGPLHDTRLKGKPQGILLAVDLGSGQTLALAQIEESNTQAMVEWLQPLVGQLGVEVIVTDDLASLGVAV
jgi:hypothetical protein